MKQGIDADDARSGLCLLSVSRPARVKFGLHKNTDSAEDSSGARIKWDGIAAGAVFCPEAPSSCCSANTSLPLSDGLLMKANSLSQSPHRIDHFSPSEALRGIRVFHQLPWSALPARTYLLTYTRWAWQSRKTHPSVNASTAGLNCQLIYPEWKIL